MSDLTGRLARALADRYRILEGSDGRPTQLGAGGMATVYLAHDLKHNRKVAVKVLHPELAAIIGGERFLIEIQTTANLQHPHILPLHDSGEADSFLYYVMPFVTGESLRSRLEREKLLPIADAVRLTTEVASALDYAHRHGVIHRDIKPENILLHDGTALVADFGIALAASKAGGSRMTETGMSLGTPEYMSPEQAMGERNLDARTDVYALGCVLYEMLTGEPPFSGPTAQSIVAKVMMDDPRPPATLRKTVPRQVEDAVLRALAKLSADRFPTAAEFASALTGDAPAISQAPRRLTGSHPKRPSMSPAVLLAALAFTAALALWGWFRPRPLAAPPPLERFSLDVTPDDRPGSPVALSPDGSRLVYVGVDSQGVSGLFIRSMERVAPQPISGTRDAIQPFFSPDGQWLGFLQNDRIRKIAIAGGAVVTICELPAAILHGASWGPGEIIVFASGGRLYRVASSGGPPSVIAEPDSADGIYYRWPDLLPDGRHVVFTLLRTEGGRFDGQLAALSIADSTVVELGQAGMSPHWVDAGFLVFTQADNALYAAPFDIRRVRFTGPPEHLAVDLQVGGGLAAKVGVARATGAFAYVEGRAPSNELLLLDRQGKVEVLPVPPDHYTAPRFSPDGGRIAVAIGPGTPTGPTDLWIYDRSMRTRTRLTFDSVSYVPAWEPGGRYLAYVGRHAGRSTPEALYRIRVDGGGTPESLLARSGPVNEVAFTPDRRHIVFREASRGTNRDVWIVAVDSPGMARPLLNSPLNERQIALSPDGRWLAYVSDEARSDDVYVRGLEDGSPRWRVSTSGGSEPRWGAGGRELLYRKADSVYAVSVTPGLEFRTGASRAILGGSFISLPLIANWDVSPDGTRFLFVRSTSAEGREALQLVLHWFDWRRP